MTSQEIIKLQEFCDTETQETVFKLLAEGKTPADIADIMDYSSPSAVRNIIYRVKRYAAAEGFSPDNDMTKQAAPGFGVTKVSTRYDKDGEVAGQWVQQKPNVLDEYNAVKEALIQMMEPFEGKAEPLASPEFTDDEMTTFYPLPDLHFGLLVDKDEMNHGYNYDLKIAEKWVKTSMKYLVDTAPKSKYAVITDLGDFLHAANNDNRTKSGHPLDADGRHSRIINVAFEVTRKLVEMALEKHEVVYFYSVPGNHSEHSGDYLKAYLRAWFRNEDRVIVDDSHKSQQYHRFGKNIIGFSHGHELRPERSPEVMVFDNQDIFSNTLYRVMHFGHFHTNKMFETPLCKIEIHKNIIPRDAWAEGMGFRGNIGEAKSITYHKEFGEVGRNIFNIRMMGE